MTSNPPPSPDDDSVLPPRHRPTLEKIVTDSAELGLWAFDDIDDIEAPPPRATPPKPRTGGIPEPRNRDRIKTKELSDAPVEKSSPSENQVQVNIGSKKKTSPLPPNPKINHAPEFADLDHWDEPDLPVSRPEDYVPIQPASISVAAMPVTPEPEPEPEAQIEPPAASVVETDDYDEFSPTPRPDAVPISLRPHLKLTKMERVGLVGLVAFLLIGGIGVILFSLNRLPTSNSLVKTTDFPIEGKFVTIGTANTYWREPITEGANAEIVRRGAMLIPAVTLTVSKGSSAIRVFFRNGDRELIGDAVTRNVEPGAAVEVAATAGFEDVGMHAAYRTGQTLPWTIEIFEGPSVNSPSNEFKKMFEMSISTERR